MEQSGTNRIPPEARYANYFSVGQAACEIVLEFGQCYENEEEPLAHTRIITTPLNANRLLELLSQSLRQYEAQHGPIQETRS